MNNNNGIFKRIGAFAKRVWRGAGSILSPGTKDRIAKDGIDWIVGKTNETIQRAGLNSAIKVEAGYKMDFTLPLIIVGGVLLVALIFKR